MRINQLTYIKSMLHSYKTKIDIFFKIKHFFIDGHSSFLKDSTIALLIRLILSNGNIIQDMYLK